MKDKKFLLVITKLQDNDQNRDLRKYLDSFKIKDTREFSSYNTGLNTYSYNRNNTNQVSKLSKRFYSTSATRKSLVNSTSPQKLVVNSSIFKITFVDNQSILLLSNILTSQDVERVKQVKQVELVIKILNCNAYAYAFYNQNLYNRNHDKPFFFELKKVLSLLKDDYYTFDFYFYIVSRKKELFEVYSYNFNHSSFDTGSSFVKINAGFGYLKLTSIKIKICKN